MAQNTMTPPRTQDSETRRRSLIARIREERDLRPRLAHELGQQLYQVGIRERGERVTDGPYVAVPGAHAQHCWSVFNAYGEAFSMHPHDTDRSRGDALLCERAMNELWQRAQVPTNGAEVASDDE